MKPILFNTDMVRAILEGRKTVTRRVVKGYALDHLELDTDGSIIGVYNQKEVPHDQLERLRCANRRRSNTTSASSASQEEGS